MEAKKTTLYFYNDNVQVGSGFFLILTDDALLEKYKSYTSRTKIYEWLDQHQSSLAKMVNGYFNEPILNKSMTFYTAKKSTDTYNIEGVKDVLGIYGVAVDQPDVDHYINYRTVSGSQFQEVMETITMSTAQVPLPLLTKGNTPVFNNFSFNHTDHTGGIHIYVHESGIFDSDGNVDTDHDNVLHINIDFVLSNDNKEVIRAAIYVQYIEGLGIGVWQPPFNAKDAQTSNTDVENPYDDDDDDGGDGEGTDPTITEAVDIPELPTVGASDFVTIYNPTSAQLNALSDFLWSGNEIFNLDNYKKLYADPMECLIGLSVLPCLPSSSGVKNIRFGNIDTGVNCTFLTSQWAKVDCGSVNIKTVANSFMDYSPHVKLQLFLPFIGFQSLDPDDVMGASLKVVYHVDILSGDCVAFLRHSSRGVIYSYAGNCLANIPMTASSYGGALKNYYQQLANVFPGMIQGGASGGAAGAAAAGIGGLVGAAESIAFNTRPTYQRSGNMSGSAGIMGVKKPFIIIERPNISVPDYVQRYAGLSANVTMKLGSLHGFTTCDYVHIEGLHATEAELNEIESLLHSGVIL